MNSIYDENARKMMGLFIITRRTLNEYKDNFFSISTNRIPAYVEKEKCGKTCKAILYMYLLKIA